MDAKILAIGLAIIIVAGGAATAIALNNNNKSGDNSDDSDKVDIKPANLTLASADVKPVLEVYGNVNNDAVIDENDKTALQAAIANGTTADYKYADANFDGTVNDADVSYIDSIINATVDAPVQVKHLNRFTNGDYYSVSYVPINSFVMTGSANMFLMAKYLGINSEIKGIAYSGLIDGTLYSEYQTFFSDNSTSVNWKQAVTADLTYRVGGSAGYFNTELVSNHITSDGVKAIVTADNASTYLKGDSSSYVGCLTEKKATDPVGEGGLNLGVFRFKAASTDMSEYLSDLAMFAFILNKDPAKISQMATWCSDFISDLNAKLTAHVGVDTNQIRVGVTSSATYSVSGDKVTTSNYISSKTSDYTNVAISAGGLFAFEDHDFGTSSSSAKMEDLGAWIKPYNVEKLIHIKTAAVTGKGAFSWYGGTALSTDGKSTLTQGPMAFSLSEAYYNNNVYVVCGDMPVILRIAYAAHVLYPEIFSAEWALNYNIDHSTKFLGLSEETIRGGIFFASMKDLGLSGGSTTA